MTHKEQNFVSAVVYLHGEKPQQVTAFFETLAAQMEQHFLHYEFIAVDDACGADTLQALRAWAAHCDHPLTMLHMSLQQGLELGMNAGLDAAIGDYVYEFDTTAMDYDAALIWKAYETALTGSDIVSVCPQKVGTASKWFYKVFNANSHARYPLRTDAFRLVSRRAVNRVHASSAHLPYRKAAYAASGLKMIDLEYNGSLTAARSGRFALAADSLLLYTDAGVKFSVGLAIAMMAVALLELLYTVVVFCTGHPVAGWTTTMFVLTVGLAGLFAVLAIVVKYLSLLVDLTFKKQKYLVESIEKIQK